MIQQYNESAIIPSLVIYSILTYYWFREYFSNINEDTVSLSDGKMTIESTRHGWCNASFGNIKISSTESANNIYKWKIKIIDVCKIE